MQGRNEVRECGFIQTKQFHLNPHSQLQGTPLPEGIRRRAQSLSSPRPLHHQLQTPARSGPVQPGETSQRRRLRDGLQRLERQLLQDAHLEEERSQEEGQAFLVMQIVRGCKYVLLAKTQVFGKKGGKALVICRTKDRVSPDEMQDTLGPKTVGKDNEKRMRANVSTLIALLLG